MRNPLFTFFKHCRNASFHGNKFDFRRYDKKEKVLKLPKRISVGIWKNYELTLDDQEKMLFEDKIKIDEAAELIDDIQKII